MSGTIIDVVYAYALLELVLDVGAVYYAVRLTRLTGAFTGWVFMIAAVVLITLQNTSSIVALAVFFPQSQIDSLIGSTNAAEIIPSSAIGIAISLTLFGAMFELYRTFRRVQARQAAAP